MKMKKKMKHTFMALGTIILASLFLASCPGPDPDPSPTGPTYTLTIRDGSGSTAPELTTASIEQGKTKPIGRTLTASDGSATTGITFTYVDTTYPSGGGGVTVNPAGSQISVAADATEGEHSFTATAVKDNAIVATANFTVTVTLAPYSLSFNPDNFSVSHGESYTLPSAWTAPNAKTSGLSLSYVCTTHSTACGLTFGRTGGATPRPQINEVANTVTVGEHVITATLLNNDTPVFPAVTATFTARVRVKYSLTTHQDKFIVNRNDTFSLGDKYTLTASDGSTPEVGTVDGNGNVVGNIIVGVSCKSDYDNCDLFADPNRNWWDLEIVVSGTATTGKVHTMMLEAQDENWQGFAEKQFEIEVAP